MTSSAIPSEKERPQALNLMHRNLRLLFSIMVAISCMVLTSLRVLPQTLLRNALCGYHMYLTTVVFDKYYMHFANENQPVFFSQNYGSTFIISPFILRDGSSDRARRKKNAVKKLVSWFGIRLIHGIITAFSQRFHIIMFLYFL